MRLTFLMLAVWLTAWLGLPRLAHGELPGNHARVAPHTAAGARAVQAPRAARRLDAAQGPGRIRERRPWRPRQRVGVSVEGLASTMWEVMAGTEEGELNARMLRQLGLRPRGMGLKDMSSWPREPRSPSRWDDARFAAAMVELCPAGLGREVSQYAHLALAAAREYGVDPALLAALVYQQSECDPARETSWGFGLTQLNRGLLPKELRDGAYPYYRATDHGWEKARMTLAPTPLSRDNLLDPQTNLRLAALHLKVLSQQCPAMDRAYEAHPHRHYVSHFVWGDEVKDAGAEDRILETRRRLLEYYEGMRTPAYAKLRGVLLVSPMDGTPRIATSGLGDDREDGKRRHAGIDYLSRFGEPVRAIASGRVVYAGTDLAENRKVNVEPDRAILVPMESMGVRGLFVELDHAEGLRSVYAHLASYTVRVGDHVERGQLLGYVGRTGIRESDPHLHFGLFADGEVVDPLVALDGLVFGPGETVREPQAYEEERLRHRQARRRARGQGPLSGRLGLGGGRSASATLE